MVAGPSKGPDRNQKPSTSTSTSTCTSTISVFVDVHVDVLVDVDVFFRLTMEVKHTPENVKLRLPPRQSRGISQRISRREHRARRKQKRYLVDRGFRSFAPAKGCALDIPPKSGVIREARSQEPK